MHTSGDIVGTHCHKERYHSIDKRARRKLIFASILCLLFMIGEVVGKKRPDTLLSHIHNILAENNSLVFCAAYPISVCPNRIMSLVASHLIMLYCRYPLNISYRHFTKLIFFEKKNYNFY